jgi:colanic acid biosynthesis protein WcaH
MKPRSPALDALLEAALQSVPDPEKGLPDAVFRFILRLTPMINADLLIRNDKGEHLLAWRQDEYGRGWHIPGGIIRFNEPIAHRIAAVARTELAAEVDHSPRQIDLRELRNARGHFVSLLYLCRLKKPVGDPSLWYRRGDPRHGQIAWRQGVPADLYWMHDIYSDWLSGRLPPG